MVKITKSFIDKIKPPASGQSTYWDDEEKGFGLRVMASGKMSYFYQGRCKGTSIKKNIGPHGRWTPDKAREEAEKQLKQLDLGVDPREVEKAEAAASVTLLEVMNDYFRDMGLKASTMAEMKRHVTLVMAEWQDLPIRKITGPMISHRYTEYKAKGLHGKGPAPQQAQAAMATLRSLINYGMRQYRGIDNKPIIVQNPVEDALYRKWTQPKARTRRIPDNRVGAVYTELWKWRATPFNSDTLSSIDLVIFLMLTGARRGEAGALKWEHVNLDEGWWHIPDPKNSNPVWLPLSSEAKRLLSLRVGLRENDYVFHTRSRTGHIGDPRATVERVSKVAGTTISCHDLRRTFSGIGYSHCDIALDKIERLTNHVAQSVTERHYLENQQLQKLLPQVQKITDWIVEQACVADQKPA